MSAQCPNCKWGIPPESTTCPVCGASLVGAQGQAAYAPGGAAGVGQAQPPQPDASVQQPGPAQPMQQYGPGYAAPFDTLRLEDVLKTSFKALVDNVRVIGPIALVCMLPAFLIEVGLSIAVMMITDSEVGSQTGDLFDRLVRGGDISFTSDPVLWFWSLFAGVVIVAGFLRMVLKFVAQAAVIYVTVEFLAGRKATIADGLRKAGNRLLTVAIAATIVTVLVSLGFMACIVPGVIVMCLFFVTIPAAVAERIGPFAAMSRSLELTRGHRVTIFLALLLIFVGAWMLGNCGSFFGGGFGALGAVISPNPITFMSTLYTWAMELLYTMIVAVMGAIVYARLRGIHDGIDAEALASVFE